jgi:hypothetical protein
MECYTGTSVWCDWVLTAFKGRVLVEMSGDLLVGRRLSMNVFKVSLIEVLCA